MRKSGTYKKLLHYLKENVSLLPDKPEETYDSTLSALWLKAYGHPLPAEKAIVNSLPALNEKQIDKLNKLIARRLEGVPLAHITGRQQFMGVELVANENALIPRKETEILGYAVLKILKDLAEKQKKIKAFDLCCGAGNLSVAIALLVPEVEFYASDLSEKALELAQENIRLYNLENRIHVAPGSVLEAFEKEQYYENIDVIICNPPYISDSKVSGMAKEIAEHEPDLAFKGGMLGINVIRELIRHAPRFLREEGWLAFEIGLGQGDFIKQLCIKTGLYGEIVDVTDDEGNIRVILAQK